MLDTAIIIAIVSLVGSVLSGACQLISRIRSSECTANGCSITRQDNEQPEVNIELANGQLTNISIDRINKIDN